MAKKSTERSDEERRRLEQELDEELAASFPASDPPKVTRVPRRDRFTGSEPKESTPRPTTVKKPGAGQ